MKQKFFHSIIIFGLGSALLVASSCKKLINDAYANPNAPVQVPIESILPNVIGGFSAFYTLNGSGYGLQSDGILLGRYIQYFGSQTAGENYGEMGGTMSSDNTGGIWGTVYFGQGENVNKIIEWGTQQQKWDYVGVAWAIRAWGWLTLTNQYGDAILQQAFNPNLQQFKYDSSALFYDSTRAICFRALSFLNMTGGNVSQANLAIGDAYFYGGDESKWKEFVYGILARSYNDLTNKDIYTANDYADSAIKYASLAMTTNDDNATSKFAGGGTSGLNNYYGPFRGNMGTIRQGAYIANLMSGLNDTAFTGAYDPRAPYLLRENINGTYEGFIPWLGTSSLGANDYPQNVWGNVTASSTAAPAVDNSRYIFDNTAEYPIMTASEMQLILAESYLRKGNAAAALTAYTNAISLNFDMLTTKYSTNIPANLAITPASKAAYLANPAVVPSTAAGLTMTHILLQKYIALYGWGVNETWTDMRRFHYTDMDAVTNSGHQVYASFTVPTGPYLVSTNNGKLAYRCRPRYNSEYLYDVPELTRIGAENGDYNTDECWFSQK
jgi:hypothetical protein